MLCVWSADDAKGQILSTMHPNQSMGSALQAL